VRYCARRFRKKWIAAQKAAQIAVRLPTFCDTVPAQSPSPVKLNVATHGSGGQASMRFSTLENLVFAAVFAQTAELKMGVV
jgi:hypothetical protein